MNKHSRGPGLPLKGFPIFLGTQTHWTTVFVSGHSTELVKFSPVPSLVAASERVSLRARRCAMFLQALHEPSANHSLLLCLGRLRTGPSVAL